MHKILEEHKILWRHKSYRNSVITGLLFLAASLVFFYTAAIYATDHASAQVRDILLDNLPTVNVTVIFVWGALFMVLFSIVLVLLKPRTLPYVLKSVAIFIVIRSLFFSMTHLGLSPSYVVNSDEIRQFNFGGDLFFSGHTGTTFLMALIFWREKQLRWIYLVASVIFAVSVLLGHLHYSIDVFAAYFITYSINEINKRFFSHEYKVFNSENSN